MSLLTTYVFYMLFYILICYITYIYPSSIVIIFVDNWEADLPGRQTCCGDVRERPAVKDEHLKFIFSSSFFFIIIITIINIILILGIVEVLTKNLSSKMTISLHNYFQNFSYCFMLSWYNTINFVNHWLSLFLFSHLAQI